MSDCKDNADNVVESDEEDGGTGMKSAYSIGDLAELDHDDEVPGDDEGKNEEGRTFGNASSSNFRNQHEDVVRCSDGYLNDLDDTRANEDENRPTTNCSDCNSDDVCRNDETSVSDGLESSGFTDRSAHGVGNDSGATNGDGGDADDEEIYPTPAEVREKKRQSLIEDSDGSRAAKKVFCDISGRFFIDKKGVKEEGLDRRPEHHYESIDDEGVVGGDAERGGTLVAGQKIDDLSMDVYENVEPVDGTNFGEDGGWASSEFEDCDDLGEQSQQSTDHSRESLLDRGKVDPAPDATRSSSTKISKKGRLDRLSWRKTRLSTQTSETPSPSTNSASIMFDKLTAKIGQKKKHESDEDADDELCMLEVALDVSKYPPAQLPPAPPGLTTLQMKRRHIVNVIIESEKSYSSSLFRLVEDYEKPLLEAKPQILSRDVIRTIFYKVREILHCHNMFQVELSEMVKVWDKEEKIGDVFTASFSKSIVFEVYSAFVNNFSVAMETAKKQARTKTAFAEFLKLKLESSEDRLSLLGLMVKPVQRFPQFLMLLQDILKFTPIDHHDRLALQLALTELDTLTDRLNETKRETDSRLEVKRLLTNLTGRIAFKVDSECYLVRQDDILEIKQKNGETQTKPRRLFLINDQLICTEVLRSSNSNFVNGDKYGFVWSIPVKDVELADSRLPSSYKVHTTPGKTTVSGQQSEMSVISGDQNPFKKELDNMIHDLTLFESMLRLSGQLHLKYETFNVDSLHGVMRYLQLMIGRRCESEHCLITLSVPTKAVSVSTEKQLKEQVVKQIGKVGRSKTVVDPEVRASTRQVVLQFETSEIKREWLLELQNTKLVTDPCFYPSWYVAENDQLPTFKHPYFHHPILLDITKDDVKKTLKSKNTNNKDMVQCATYVTLPSADAIIDLSIQHLWVCNGDQTKGQVSIVSLHSNVPCVVESFRVCDNLICSAESVPSIAGAIDSIYGETVWMSTDDKKIIICNVVEMDRSNKRQTINTDSVVTCLKYHNGRIFAGMRNGSLSIFSYHDNRWDLKNPLSLNLGSMRISCLLPINKEMFVSSNLSIHVVTVSPSKSSSIQLIIDKICHELSGDLGQIECMVKAGVGLMVSFSNLAVIRLYHLETFQHLQDINIASAITPLLEGKQLISPFNEDRRLYSMSITCLLSGKGLLWVGTNYGFVLTLPLPRLEGVPQVKRRPTVSFHAHGGPVKFLAATHCGGGGTKAPSASVAALNSVGGCARPDDDDRVLAEHEEGTRAVTSGSEESTRPSEGDASKEENNENALNSSQKSQWISTPELHNRAEDSDGDSDISSLYGSLLKGVDADMDAGLIRPPPKHRSLRGSTFHSSISTKVSKLSHAVRKNLKPSSGHHDRTDGKCDGSVVVASPATDDPGSLNASNDEEPGLDVVTGAVSPRLLLRDESTESYGGISSVERDSEERGAAETAAPISFVETPIASNGTSEFVISERANSTVTVTPTSSSSCVMTVAAGPASRSRHSTNKRLIVVSGGEGHVNWKDAKPFDKSYEDICLLLWKY